LIADELQTGWARSGKWWAYELANIEPDIVTAAKSMGAGIPLTYSESFKFVWKIVISGK